MIFVMKYFSIDNCVYIPLFNNFTLSVITITKNEKVIENIYEFNNNNNI